MATPKLFSMLAMFIIGSTVMAMAQPEQTQNSEIAAPPRKHNHHHHHHQHHHHPHPHPNSPANSPADSPANSPESDIDKYLNSIPKKLKDLVQNCTKLITKECADEIVGKMFDSTINIDAQCCHQLVTMGRKCHNALVKVFSGLPDVQNDAAVLHANSKKVYKYCVRLEKTNNKNPSPAPTA